MDCNIVSHITDSRFFRAGYTTDEARNLFCDYRRLQRWLDVEMALARSQADLGIIPEGIVEDLEKFARLNLLDTSFIQQSIKTSGHSLMGLLKAWQTVTGEKSASYIHFGATTQDIQDSAQSLELKDVFILIERDLAIVIGNLIELCRKFGDQVMVGRTHGQHALPMTFGLKVAVWLDELLRNADRLAKCKERVLVSQLFGGVGTMAAFGEKGLEILDNFSQRLELAPANTAWHAARDRLTEFLSTAAIVAGCLGKIANELCQLSRGEIGELSEPFHMGKIGSSTMPHKRNPELSEQVVVLARLIKGHASLSFDGLINEHERDYRSVRLEWVTVVDSSLYLCGAFNLMKIILKDLNVHKDAMESNLQKSAALVSTEALMFLIGEQIGKPAAHQLVYEVSMAAYNSGEPLVDHLMSHPQIKDRFSREILEETTSPEKHIGLAKILTNRVVENAKDWLSSKGDVKIKSISCPLKNKEKGCLVNKDL